MGPSELIAIAGIAITVLMAVAGSVVGHYVKYLKQREKDLEKQVKELEKRVRDLQKEVEEKHPSTDGKLIEGLRAQLDKATSEVGRLEAELKDANTNLRWT